MWIHKRSLLIGAMLALPFLFANVLVALQSQLFLTLLRPLGETTNYEHLLVLILIALVGVGGFVCLLPLVKERRLYIVNMIVGVAFISFAFFGGYGLGYDFYKCDILKIPNCD